MLRSRLLIASSVAALTALASVACGGGDGETTSGSSSDGGGGSGSGAGGPGGSGAGAGSGSTVGLPPGPPEGPAGDGPGQVYAINKVFAGETDRSGAPSATAWKKFGFNLDGQVSTADSSGHCKPADGGVKGTIQTDGENGIDNAFGSAVLVKLKGIEQEPSKKATDAIRAGDFTIILKIDGLGDGKNYNPLKTGLYGGADLGKAPLFDGTDAWPVIHELTNGGDINSPKIAFPSSYLIDDLWVSGAPQKITINLSFGSIVVNLDINKALIAMEVDADRNGVKNGVIGGVVPTEPLIEQIKQLAKGVSSDFCDENNPTLATAIKAIRAASDIMQDGSQNPDATCDGISIGLGFEMKPIQLGEVADPVTSPPDPCAGQ